MFIRKKSNIYFPFYKICKNYIFLNSRKIKLEMKALRASLISKLKFKFRQSFADDFIEFLL
jgi:hypothetical protein